MIKVGISSGDSLSFCTVNVKKVMGDSLNFIIIISLPFEVCVCKRRKRLIFPKSSFSGQSQSLSRRTNPNLIRLSWRVVGNSMGREC